MNNCLEETNQQSSIYLQTVNSLKNSIKYQNFISKTKLTVNEIKNIIKWYDLKRNQRIIRQVTQPDQNNDFQKQIIQQGIVINQMQQQINKQSIEMENLKKAIFQKGNEKQNGIHQKSKSSNDDFLDKQINFMNKQQNINFQHFDKDLENQIKTLIQQEFEKIYKLLSQQLKSDINDIVYQSIQEQIFVSNNNSPKPDTLRKYSQTKQQSEDSQQNINVIVECLNEQIDEYSNNNYNFNQFKAKLKCLKLKQINLLYEDLKNSQKQNSLKDYFIGPLEKLQQFSFNFKQSKLLEYVNGQRRAREDSNNFYAVFGYQYLDIILTHADDQNFETFMENIKGIPFDLFNNQSAFTKEEQQELKEIFCYRCIELRQIEISQRSNELWHQISDNNNSFYGLTMIFIRNLIYQIVQQSELNEHINIQDPEQFLIKILEWNTPCPESEFIMEVLSHELELCIILFYLKEEQQEFSLRIFGDEQNYQLYILQNTNECYSIGIKEQT
ncbi:unnamed protein product [Paramecium pentaurelia]|uniref:Uncharacterized protein n=1 Tax=Paramecium pentaurelia TaxID=43138 RepID=A0A8S1TCE2_9CILI|nr:unnamed protein product [Paramecium pentaurelia]